jgi:hypothetical protein
VLPQWEYTTKSLSIREVESEVTKVRIDTGLDELEKMMGMDMGIGIGLDSKDVTTSTTSGSERRDSQIVKKNTQKGGECIKGNNNEIDGCIPIHWFCGLFASSIPAPQTCVLWDWAILNNDRFAGVYLTATLLGLYASSLREMSGSEVRLWFENASLGSDDWFNKLPNSSGIEPRDWSSFTRGWLHATHSLKSNTPISFKDSLCAVEISGDNNNNNNNNDNTTAGGGSFDLSSAPGTPATTIYTPGSTSSPYPPITLEAAENMSDPLFSSSSSSSPSPPSPSSDNTSCATINNKPSGKPPLLLPLHRSSARCVGLAHTSLTQWVTRKITSQRKQNIASSLVYPLLTQ